MGALRSAVDELASEDLALADDDELAGSLQELERATSALEAERARRVAEVARRGAFRRDGFLSTTSWLAARLRVTGGCAARYVRTARMLERAGATREALAAGDITASATVTLAAAFETDRAAYVRDEWLLVDAARSLTARDLASAVGYWRRHAEAGDEAELRSVARRRLHVSPTLDGMVRLDGDLDAETGQAVITALRAVVDAEARAPRSAVDPDERTPAQRRADALGEICRRYLDGTDRPAVAGERPHLLVVADLPALRGDTGRAELSDAGALSRSALRRLACDASVSRVITRGRSEPLDVGRRTPVVPPALRRALVVRDGGCAFPGCERPHPWCDAHHVVHWADGGETRLDNLLLLCRPHHRAVHGRFTVTMRGGRGIFRRADGSVLDAFAGSDRAPP